MRRCLRNNKAWLRIIEIALAATLVFSFMIFINNFEGASRPQRPETDKYILQQLGEDALLSYDLMDSNNDYVTDLREEVLASDWADIGTQLNSTFGSSIGYSLYFYTGNQVSFATGHSTEPINRDIVSVHYLVAGDDGQYCTSGKACALKLDMWYVK